MNEDGVRFDLDALSERVEQDPGAPEFPALAEALRRSGAVERARAVAEAGLESAPSRLAGRVALALVRMDLGEPVLGREELEKVLDEMLEPYRIDAEPEAPLTPVAESPPAATPAAIDADPLAGVAEQEIDADPLAAVAEQEIDAAFEAAEPQTDEMHSPNTMAQSVLDAEAPFEPEPEPEPEPTIGEEPGYDVAASGAFATRTMAGLLEEQGDHDRAESIRSSLDETRVALGLTEHDDPLAGFAPDPLDVEASAQPPEAVPVEADLENASPTPAFDRADGRETPPVPLDAAEAPPLAPAPMTPASSEDARRARVLATLERWLHNLQRGVA